MMPLCAICSEPFAKARAVLGYRTCLYCGEKKAKEQSHCIVPMNKSNYVVVTDKSLLAQLNPKRTS